MLASSAIDFMYEWSMKYPNALDELPRKNWISMEMDKVDFKIKMQLHEKLSRDLDKVMASYKTLYNALEYLFKVHKIPSIGALG